MTSYLRSDCSGYRNTHRANYRDNSLWGNYGHDVTYSFRLSLNKGFACHNDKVVECEPFQREAVRPLRENYEDAKEQVDGAVKDVNKGTQRLLKAKEDFNKADKAHDSAQDRVTELKENISELVTKLAHQDNECDNAKKETILAKENEKKLNADCAKKRVVSTTCFNSLQKISKSLEGLEGEEEELNTRVDELANSVELIEKHLDTAKRDKDAANKAVNDAQKSEISARELYEEVNKEVQIAKTKLDETQAKCEVKEKQVDNTQTNLAQEESSLKKNNRLLTDAKDALDSSQSVLDNLESAYEKSEDNAETAQKVSEKKSVAANDALQEVTSIGNSIEEIETKLESAKTEFEEKTALHVKAEKEFLGACAACKDGWDQFENKCFKLFTGSSTYDEGVKQCNDHFAQLAKFNSKKETDFAAEMITNLGEVLIGWKDGKWTDGTAPSDWFERHQGKGGGSCTRLIGTSHSWQPGTFDDWPCDKEARHGILCSYKNQTAISEDPKSGSRCVAKSDTITVKEKAALEASHAATTAKETVDGLKILVENLKKELTSTKDLSLQAKEESGEQIEKVKRMNAARDKLAKEVEVAEKDLAKKKNEYNTAKDQVSISTKTVEKIRTKLEQLTKAETECRNQAKTASNEYEQKETIAEQKRRELSKQKTHVRQCVERYAVELEEYKKLNADHESADDEFDTASSHAGKKTQEVRKKKRELKTKQDECDSTKADSDACQVRLGKEVDKKKQVEKQECDEARSYKISLDNERAELNIAERKVVTALGIKNAKEKVVTDYKDRSKTAVSKLDGFKRAMDKAFKKYQNALKKPACDFV